MVQDKENGYNSMEEFLRELTNWGKQWVSHYCHAAVDTSEQGEISMIRGKILFKRELEQLCIPPFSVRQMEKYEAETAELLAQLILMHKKSREYIAGGGMLVTEYIYQAFGFDDFEWYLFCMAYMAELDAQFERIFVALQDDFDKKVPTIDLCIRMYTLDEERQYELKHRVLERWDFLSQFMEGEAGKFSVNGKADSILNTPLQLDRRIVNFLYDIESEDMVLKEAVSCLVPAEYTEGLLIREKELAILTKMYQSAGRNSFLYLSGEQEVGKFFLVKQLAKCLNCPLLVVDMQRFADLQYDTTWLVKRLMREAALKGNAIVCMRDMEGEEEEDFSTVEEILHSVEFTHMIPILISNRKWREAIKTGTRTCMQVHLAPLSVKERKILWEAYLAKSQLEGNVDVERLAATYRLPSGAIERVVRETELKYLLWTRTERRDADGGSLEKMLYEGCQKQLVHNLGKDAVRVPAQYTMEELVLPRAQKILLRDACNMVKYHHHVFETWGFNSKMAYGKGVSMIFYGPPGTGKTMGAQAIANELNLELYRVDMASVLSKYVGESEKKLGNIFEQGQKSQSILFFDEADALFGKRSEVKDSQDKYANASTAFLLQKLEEYQGIIILATNLLQNFDQAFCRRFQFIVEFPFPDEKRRKEIWQRVFPEELPREDLDFDYLADEFVLSGSQIKNIAVAAAFQAVGEAVELKMVHILRTIKREMKKVGKNMIASDFGVYYSLMENEEGEI